MVYLHEPLVPADDFLERGFEREAFVDPAGEQDVQVCVEVDAEVQVPADELGGEEQSSFDDDDVAGADLVGDLESREPRLPLLVVQVVDGRVERLALLEQDNPLLLLARLPRGIPTRWPADYRSRRRAETLRGLRDSRWSRA